MNIKNPTNSIAIIVLAAGKGTRMGAELPKVLVECDGSPMLLKVLEAASMLEDPNGTKIKKCIVVGHQAERVRETISSSDFSDSLFATQELQNGTGSAAMCGAKALENFTGTILILSGDVPLIKGSDLKNFIEHHEKENSTVSFLSTRLLNPGAYGRVIRDQDQRVQAIVEAKDCTPQQYLVNEINAGVYAIDSSFLKPALETLSSDNAQGELYLTDIVAKASEEGQNVSALCLEDPSSLLGVNTLYELSQAQATLRQRRIRKIISKGITVADPNTFYIESGVSIGKGSVVGPNVILSGDTTIGENVTFEGNTFVKNSTIESNTIVKFSCRIEEAHVKSNCAVGPFAHLRPGTELHEEVKVGNFVETKKAIFEKGAKASHLSYLGDCTVGENANVGAGTITCNYDGVKKSQTKIGKNSFIGSNTALVAPVTIGENAFVGAGSTITKDVEDNALSLTRAEQKSIGNWAKRKKSKR